MLASCPFSGALQIWDAHTGEQVRTLRLPKGSNGIASYPTPSPDGRTLYVPSYKYQTTSTRKDGQARLRYDVEGEITVWDVASGRQLPSLKQSPPHGVAFVRPSPDGVILLSGDYVSGVGLQRALTQWDLRTGKPHHLLDGWWSGAFAPDGKTFAANLADLRTNRGKLALWDVASGKERRVFAETEKGWFSSPVFSADGHTLAAVQDLRTTKEPPAVKLWDVASGKEVGSFAAPKKTTPFLRSGNRWGAFAAPAFSPDGRWLAACLLTGRVYLYDVAGRKPAWSRDVKNDWLRQLAFSPDGRWLAVAAQELPGDLKAREEVSPFDVPQPRIFLFDMKAGSPPEEIVTPHGLIGQLAFSPDSKTLALSGTGCVWLFDVSR